MARRTHNNNRIERQGPRFNEVLLIKIGVTVTATIGLVLLTSIFFIPTKVEVLGNAKDQSEARRQLTAKLETLRTTWEPRRRRRILDKAPDQAEYFAGPLDRILRMRDPKLLEAAVDYAGALGVADLRPVLARMAISSRPLPPGVRSKAMKAAERLGPWGRNQLAEFLTEGTPPMKLAALEICANRPDAPWTEVLALLSGGGDNITDQMLTTAAIKAIPEIPPPELVKVLWEMIAYGDADGVVLGLRALRRARLDPEMYSKLAGGLEHLHSDAQMICLDLLGRAGKRLPDPVPVWTLVKSPDTKPLVRARALYCLEQTRSFEVQDVRKQVFYMDPLAKYFAARCLLAADQKDGADILLDLVDIEDDKDLSVASRRLLAWMTGKGPGTSRKEFQNSLARTTHRSAGRLPAPGYDFEDLPATPDSGR